MKISNSKKQLAQIIHENGGWREGANWYVQHHTKRVVASEERPVFDDGVWRSRYFFGGFFGERVRAWHQTILSRDEYFHLYPVPEQSIEAICEKVNEDNKHESVDAKPTIEQLALDYRNRKDYADRKRQEADDAKADAEAKLSELVAAGKALGLVLSVVGVAPEPELVVTDWRDLRVGDIVWWSGGSKFSQGEYRICDLEDHAHEGPFVILLDVGACRQWVDIAEEQWCFIRRPAKGGADA